MELSPPAATSAEQTGLNAASPPQQSATASRGQSSSYSRSKQSPKCRSSSGSSGNGNRGSVKRKANSIGAEANGDAAAKTAKDLILTAAASLILKQANNSNNGANTNNGASVNIQNQLTSLIAQALQNMVCERSHGQQQHSCSCSSSNNNSVSGFEQLLAASSAMTVAPVNKIVYLFEQFSSRSERKMNYPNGERQGNQRTLRAAPFYH